MQKGAERITRRILDDARDEAERITAEAAAEAAEKVKDAGNEAAAKREQILTHARREAEEQKRRIIGMAELEARKELLAVKQELIKEAFERALQELAHGDDQAYLAVLRSLLLTHVERGDETVICSDRDRERIPSEFWEELNGTLAERGITGAIKLSSEPRPMQGGFILQTGGMEINCSLEALLQSRREELEPDVAALLFPGG